MNIDKVIQEQELFVRQVSLTLDFLKAYKGNPVDFELIISKEISDSYRFDFTNYEYIWESIDELTFDILNKSKKFVLKANGIFQVLHFAKPKKKTTCVEDIEKWIRRHSHDGWGL